eukprot:2703558-Rhodomonas_salina.1
MEGARLLPPLTCQMWLLDPARLVIAEAFERRQKARQQPVHPFLHHHVRLVVPRPARVVPRPGLEPPRVVGRQVGRRKVVVEHRELLRLEHALQLRLALRQLRERLLVRDLPCSAEPVGLGLLEDRHHQRTLPVPHARAELPVPDPAVDGRAHARAWNKVDVDEEDEVGLRGVDGEVAEVVDGVRGDVAVDDVEGGA